MEINPDDIALQTQSFERKEPFWQTKGVRTFIYGTGSVANSVYQVLTNRGIPVAGFLDHRSRDIPFLDGIAIFRPESPEISSEARREANIILAIHNREAQIPPIIQNLRRLGYQNLIPLLELYDTFGKDLGDRYWLTARSFYFSVEGVIEQAFNLLADEASKSLYKTILRFRITGDYTLLPEPMLHSQYFPEDIPAWETPLRLVDCGAYDGDTLASFIQAHIPIEAVAAFEPDQENFRRLARFVAQDKAHLPESMLWPCGLSSSTRQMRFDAAGGEASSLSAGGASLVQCVSLDEAIPDFAPTLIKMDIEGAEYDALLGAQRIISSFRPGLAISVYHRPEHLWQIPLLIECLSQTPAQSTENPADSLQPLAYRYYLRSHAYNDFELILYALPK
jgi:FkbM family methyltransferase